MAYTSTYSTLEVDWATYDGLFKALQEAGTLADYLADGKIILGTVAVVKRPAECIKCGYKVDVVGLNNKTQKDLNKALMIGVKKLTMKCPQCLVEATAKI